MQLGAFRSFQKFEMTWQIALQSALQIFLLPILSKKSLTSVESSGKGRGFHTDSHDASVAENLVSSDFSECLSPCLA